MNDDSNIYQWTNYLNIYQWTMTLCTLLWWVTLTVSGPLSIMDFFSRHEQGTQKEKGGGGGGGVSIAV